MKFGDGFSGFGSNLILNGESTEDLTFRNARDRDAPLDPRSTP
jgi:hypothetical protein